MVERDKMAAGLTGNIHDAKLLNIFRSLLWQAIKTLYPMAAEPNKLNLYKWSPETPIIDFMQEFQTKWKEHTLNDEDESSFARDSSRRYPGRC